MFSAIYRNQLAKRILNNRSLSDDSERAMIGKLKLKCGAQFTSRMEGMINDLKLGVDAKKEFAEFQKEHSASGTARAGLSFNVDVLSTGHWPSYTKLDARLPAEMSSCVELFTKYFKKTTNQKVLSWMFSLGTVTMKARMKRTYTLTLSTLQAIALIYPNDRNAPRAIQELQESQHRRSLLEARNALACVRKAQALLKKKSKGQADDEFRVNAKFSSKKMRIVVPMASLEVSHKPKKVEEDRKHAVEACIVRIMKARKRLAHSVLISEVLQQLHFFKPRPKMVKQRIEDLIIREYLERDENRCVQIFGLSKRASCRISKYKHFKRILCVFIYLYIILHVFIACVCE